MDRKDLQELSRVRLKEAKALLKLGLNDGAYYLAGYSVECALKACIARQTQRFEFPDKDKVNRGWTHELNKLVNVAGLADELRDRTKRDFEFLTNWVLLSHGRRKAVTEDIAQNPLTNWLGQLMKGVTA